MNKNSQQFSDTPRSDKAMCSFDTREYESECFVPLELSQELEKELNLAKSILTRLVEANYRINLDLHNAYIHAAQFLKS